MFNVLLNKKMNATPENCNGLKGIDNSLDMCVSFQLMLNRSTCLSYISKPNESV